MKKTLKISVCAVFVICLILAGSVTAGALSSLFDPGTGAIIVLSDSWTFQPVEDSLWDSYELDSALRAQYGDGCIGYTYQFNENQNKKAMYGSRILSFDGTGIDSADYRTEDFYGELMTLFESSADQASVPLITDPQEIADLEAMTRIGREPSLMSVGSTVYIYIDGRNYDVYIIVKNGAMYQFRDCGAGAVLMTKLINDSVFSSHPSTSDESEDFFDDNRYDSGNSGYKNTSSGSRNSSRSSTGSCIGGGYFVFLFIVVIVFYLIKAMIVSIKKDDKKIISIRMVSSEEANDGKEDKKKGKK